MGLSSTIQELKLFEQMGSQVSLPGASLEDISEDLTAVVDARREFNSLPNRDKILEERKQSTMVFKNAPGPPKKASDDQGMGL